MLFAHAISAGTDCLVCSTFFRRLLIDAGRGPGRPAARRPGADRRRLRPATGPRPATASPTSCSRGWPRASRPEQIVALTAFGGLMVATNLFNNALRVDLDEYLWTYRKPERLSMSRIERAHRASAFGPGRAGRLDHGRGARPGAGDGPGPGPRGRARSRRSTSPGRWPIPAIRLGSPTDLETPGRRSAAHWASNA